MTMARWLVELYEYKVADLAAGREPPGGRRSLHEIEGELRALALEPQLLRRFLELRARARELSGTAPGGSPEAAVLAQSLRHAPLAGTLLSPDGDYLLLRAVHLAAATLRGREGGELPPGRYSAAGHAARVGLAFKAAAALPGWAAQRGEDPVRAALESALSRLGGAPVLAAQLLAGLRAPPPPVAYLRPGRQPMQLRLYHHRLLLWRVDTATVTLSQLGQPSGQVHSLGCYPLRDGVAALAVRPGLVGALYVPHLVTPL